MCVLSSCCSFCFVLLVVFIFFIVFILLICGYSLSMYRVNECYIRDEYMFFFNKSPTMMFLAEKRKNRKKEKKKTTHKNEKRQQQKRPLQQVRNNDSNTCELVQWELKGSIFDCTVTIEWRLEIAQSVNSNSAWRMTAFCFRRIHTLLHTRASPGTGKQHVEDRVL